MQSRDFRDFVERVKLRSPIETIVQERVPELKRRGANWKACCPFHEEKTPSFVVTPERGTWRCFGACGEGGDVISFVQRFDGLSFLEALRLLAQACGEAMPSSFERSHGDDRERRTAELVEAMERAQGHYGRLLHGPEGAEALAYARDRGLTDETLEAFGIGFAPRQGKTLLEAARGAGFDEELLVQAGLVRRGDGERAFDFFRGRLMIPIRDGLGRTVGFGGRKLPGDELPGPKYVNTGETPLFKKSRLIYGLDRARQEVRRTKHLILMEGYTDVMAAHQVGIGNAAAVLGTATTDEHASLVRRSGARRVTLVFDGDEAGSRAGLRALEHLLPLGLELDVVVLPEGCDPCDLCIERGAEAFGELLAAARDWYDHALDLLNGLSGARLGEEVDEILKLVLRLKHPVERDQRLAQMARHLDLPEEGVRAQAQALVQGRRPPAPAPEPSVDPVPTPSPEPADPRLTKAFEGLVGAALLDNSLIPGLRAHREDAPEGPVGRLLDVILELYDEGDEELAIDAAALLNALGSDPARELVVPLADRAARAETPQVLARDQLAWLDRRAREHEVRRQLQALPEDSALDDQATRDALRALHRELRGIKVPAALGTHPPQKR